MLVDVGCGTGAFARRVHERYGAVVGVDFIPLARSNSENVHFVRADLRHGIPLGDGVADTVTAIEVVEHIANPILLVREAFRIARPGGKFVLTTPNVRYVRQLLRLIVRGEGPRTAGRYDDELLWDGGHLHYFTSKDLVALLKGVGFVSIRSMALMRSEGFLPVVRRWLSRWPGNPLVREFLTGRLLVTGTKPRGTSGRADT
jgi:SAM-dependent methyltransferase